MVLLMELRFALCLVLCDVVLSKTFFELGWTRNISSPFDPMALGVVGRHKKVIVVVTVAR